MLQEAGFPVDLAHILLSKHSQFLQIGVHLLFVLPEGSVQGFLGLHESALPAVLFQLAAYKLGLLWAAPLPQLQCHSLQIKRLQPECVLGLAPQLPFELLHVRGAQNLIHVIQEVSILSEQRVRRVLAELKVHSVHMEDRLQVLEAPHFLRLYLFEVVCVDVVPELSEQGLVGMVVDVGLRVRHLEIGAALVKMGKEEIADCDHQKRWYLRD